ncbi:hypothetical protein G4B11_006227 [Aspergillus flavus]|nr:hypothetical protein G4B11_006227 [Aspergillus flavus]
MTITKAALLVPITACLGQLKWNLYRRSAPLEYMQAIDVASRGSWCSFQILYRVNVGAKTGALTFFGAFLTLSALAVDPLAQQILTFPSQLTRASNETAFIQYAQNYSSGIAYYYDGSRAAIGLSPVLPRAIMSGLSLSNFSLQLECCGGSCSYPRFVSLGICSQCKDITEQMVQECQGDALELDGTFWVQSGPSMNCTYTAPYGFNFALHPQDISQLVSLDRMGSMAKLFIFSYREHS